MALNGGAAGTPNRVGKRHFQNHRRKFGIKLCFWGAHSGFYHQPTNSLTPESPGGREENSQIQSVRYQEKAKASPPPRPCGAQPPSTGI